MIASGPACDGCKRRGNFLFGRSLFCGGVGFRVLDMGSGSLVAPGIVRLYRAVLVGISLRQSRYYIFNLYKIQV